jgi:putative DNA primase/helicase
MTSKDDERDVRGATAASREAPKLEVLDGGVAWPKPKPLAGEPAVDVLAPEIIPEALRERSLDVAERMQVPIDYVFAASVCCLAGAVNRRAAIQPKACDTTWRVIPNLYGAIVGDAGSKKSPVVHDTAEPLRQAEALLRAGNEEVQREYQRASEQYKQELAAWREKIKKGLAADRPEPPEQPKNRRLVINDSTFESVQAAMRDNPAGLFMIRDELVGWLAQLDRTGHEGERGFYLTAWDGRFGYDMMRIGRGDLNLSQCCLSIVGTLTPDRLRAYLVDLASKQAQRNDGLIQRFGVLVWPDLPAEFKSVDRPPNRALINRAAGVFSRLAEMDENDPVLFRFDPAESQPLFREWEEDLENKKLRNPNLHPELRSHLAKYGKLMPALALLFELADRVVEKKPISPRPADSPGYRFVSRAHTEQAIAACKYFESHAVRVYASIQTSAMFAVSQLSTKIREKKVGSPFALADVYQKGWSGLNTESTKKAVDALIDLDWIRPVEDAEGLPHYGPRATRFEINPRVHMREGKLHHF